MILKSLKSNFREPSRRGDGSDKKRGSSGQKSADPPGSTRFREPLLGGD
jgi:hypothetical protein